MAAASALSPQISVHTSGVLQVVMAGEKQCQEWCWPAPGTGVCDKHCHMSRLLTACEDFCERL